MHKMRCLLVVLSLSALTCSAQSSEPSQQELQLSLKRAIQIATESRQSVAVRRGELIRDRAKSNYGFARSNLLPNLSGAVTEQNQTVNLKALGIRSEPGSGLTLPESVGPFSTFDTRIRLTQDILDVSAIRNLQAAGVDRQVADAENRSIRDDAAARVAKAYAAALEAEAKVKDAQANIALAVGLRDLAAHKRSVGEGTDIEVARTRLAVLQRRQRLLVSQGELRQADLDLINLLNLDWSTRLKLTGKLELVSGDLPLVSAAVARAMQSRPDLQEQEKRAASAKLRSAAARLERLPSIVGYGDYGWLSGVQTHTVGATIKIPLFAGGRMESDRAAALSVMRHAELQEEIIRKRVELEIRKSSVTLVSARQEVMVAEQAVSFANEVLAHARRLYDAGLTNSSEVLDAQTQLEQTEDERVAALFDYTNARIGLANAMGTITELEF